MDVPVRDCRLPHVACLEHGKRSDVQAAGLSVAAVSHHLGELWDVVTSGSVDR